MTNESIDSLLDGMEFDDSNSENNFKYDDDIDILIKYLNKTWNEAPIDRTYGCKITYKFQIEKEMNKLIPKINQNKISQIAKYYDDNLPIIKEAQYKSYVGHILTIAINNSQDDVIRLNFKNGNKIRNLGTDLKNKIIIIDGNIGSAVGYMMRTGEIIVNGNSDAFLGQTMLGGKITVNGNVGDLCGIGMHDGSIHINGEIMGYCGQYMKGGEIYVNSNIKPTFKNKFKGKTYWNGKRIHILNKN